VECYELRRAPDAMDVVPVTPGAKFTPCWRPLDHPGMRHTSESSYKRMLAQGAVRSRERRERRRNVGPG
jgi:hypothetical protein